MNAITAELHNLANGCAAEGDLLAMKICSDAITEIERLQYYPRVIADLNKGLYANRRVCEIIERLVTEAVEESKVRCCESSGVMVKTHQEQVVFELRKELLLDLIPDYIPDDDLLKQTKGSFLMFRVEMRLRIQAMIQAIKKIFFWWM